MPIQNRFYSGGLSAVFIAISQLLIQPAQADLLPELIVSADQVPVPSKAAGSAVTVIGSEEIENSKAVTLVDILRGQPGVSLNQAGTRGSLTEIRMRGSEANHVLVYVDGIEVNRPGEGGFDFSGLLAADVERVEILRGPQSGIYGSNAMGGVISIVTKSGRGLEGYEGNVRAEGGTRGSAAGGFTFRAGKGPAWGSLSVSGLTTDGDNIARSGNEKDGTQDFSVIAKGGFEVSPALEVDGVLRYVNRSVESDPQDFDCLAFDAFFNCLTPSPTYGLVIDGADFSQMQDLSGRATARLTTMDGAWIHELTGSFNAIDTRFQPGVGADSRAEERRQAVLYKSIYNFQTGGGAIEHTITGLLEFQRETFRQTQATATPSQRTLKVRDTGSAATEYLVRFGNASLTGALRHDANDGFADATTWRATGAYDMPQVAARFHASIGTAVTNPTFYELFGFFPNQFVGNPALKPESSKGFDIGVEKTFLDGDFVVDVTYFQQDLEDEIITVFGFPASTAANVAGKSQRKGVEVSAKWQPLAWLDLTAAYTYLESTQTGFVREVRRPRHSGRVDATARFADDRARVTVGAKWSAGMIDTEFLPNFPYSRIAALKDFVTVDAAVSYLVRPDVEVYARVENLFDAKYEEVFSYEAPGVTAYAGVVWRFGASSQTP
ncbi:MAG: TonB-dependent receptor [Rhodobiaceae bacterium]|nr:TonB-dependent receptor [Rhodobiaceae bacterium]MCC0055976.1 TonB-dependent receptor [Rhodobiaceae bacterium]